MRDNQALSFSIYGFVIVFLLAIQSIQAFSIGGVYPDFMLLMTIIVALSRGSFKGEIFGFFVGFALDLMSGTLFGINAFIFTLLGALATPFQKAVKVASIIVFIFYLIFATSVKYILYSIFYNIYEGTELLDFYFVLKIPSEIMINIFIGVILYIIAARFHSRDNYDWF
ncbi:MAG: rod shape-determining protein MreD [Brevinema sp.]